MLNLPTVSLVCYEVRAHKLAHKVLAELLSEIEFREVHVWTNSLEVLSGLGSFMTRPGQLTAHPTDGSLDKIEGQKIMWREFADWAPGSHVLNVEWDSGLNSVEKWSDDFLNFDYVGAPWPWHPDRRVGNGGFALISTKLLQFIRDNFHEYPLGYGWDDILCRQYRPVLEALGFCWAPEELAREFSFERDHYRSSFGYHGMFNWPLVYNKADLCDRLSLANNFVVSKPEYKELGLG